MNSSAVAHFAINADDVERARRFYTTMLGWRFEAWGPPGFYRIRTTIAGVGDLISEDTEANMAGAMRYEALAE